MSLLVRTLDEDQLQLVYAGDGPADWAYELGDPEADPYVPKLEGNERTGIWFGFSLDQDRWFALLRRDDTPYNDCLPPVGWLAGEAWASTSTAEACLRDLADRVADRFLNPFDAYSGLVSKPGFYCLSQTFDSNLKEFESTPLEQSNHKDHQPETVADESGGIVPPDQLFRSLDEGGLFHDDPRLPTRAAVAVSADLGAERCSIHSAVRTESGEINTC